MIILVRCQSYIDGLVQERRKCYAFLTQTHRYWIGPVHQKFENLRYNTDYECFANSVSPAPVVVRII